MLEKHTLTGPNFNEWFRAFKLVVHTEKIQDVLKTALPPRPVGVGDEPVDPQALAKWTAKYDRHNEVACLMLGSMTPRLYQQFEHKTLLEMYNELYQMVQKKLHGKAKGKGKAKGGQYSYPFKTKKPQPQKKEHPEKEGQCHHCKVVGHWKRNCLIYLAELKKKKSGQMVASTTKPGPNP
nr:hypothetical protein [Tanacetum cinerariifolium]